MGSDSFAADIRRLAETGSESVSALIDRILDHARSLHASDIHLDPTPTGIIIRARLDGVLQTVGEIPQGLRDNVVARCKVLGGLLTYRTDIPQEGSLSRSGRREKSDLRISTFPTLHGERVAFRFFNNEDNLIPLDELGFPAAILEAICGALIKTEGLNLITGPCGSGKTTTLYACLLAIQKTSQNGRSIVTIEDPVENTIEGTIQTSINPAVDLTFSKSLRSLLRQDPEVLMLGEIRDAETAAIAVESSLTGHLILSTLHAPGAAAVPHRLLDMGLEPYTLAGALRLIIAQRLLRALCPDCTEPEQGCDACSQTGYHGRVLLSECLPTSDMFHDGLMTRTSRDVFAAMVREAGGDMEKHARALVADGITSESEVRRVLN